MSVCSLTLSYVNEIKIHIPIYAWFAKPITVYVDTVVLVLATRPPTDWNRDLFRDLFIRSKERALIRGETSAYMNTFENGLLWRLVMKLCKNVKVQVKNVHLRIEDRVARKSIPLAIGNFIQY